MGDILRDHFKLMNTMSRPEIRSIGYICLIVLKIITFGKKYDVVLDNCIIRIHAVIIKSNVCTTHYVVLHICSYVHSSFTYQLLDIFDSSR